MTDSKNVFTGDRALLVNVNIEGPLKDADRPSCKYFSSPYFNAAKHAEDTGDAQTAATYRFLSVLVGFQPSYDTPEQPYVPIMQWEGKRSLIPSDLTTDDIAALRELAPLAKDVALRSRLFDLVWELTKDHKACGLAAEAYVAAAERLDTPENWLHASTCYQRAVQLAAKLGRGKELFQKVAKSLQRATRASAGEQEAFRCCRYLRLIQRYGCGDAAVFAGIAEKIAQDASKADNPYKARAYWEVAADLRESAKDAGAATAARLAAGETYVIEAEKGATGNVKMAAASSLIKGIEALRRAGAAPERIEELRRKLGQYQEGLRAEMQTFSTEIDISDAVESARQHVKCATLNEALFRFALGYNLTDLKELKETVIQVAKDHPLTHLLGASIVDSKGRVVKQKPGLLHLQGEELEEQIKAEMFSHASQFMWSLRVSSYIDPGRLQILNDHHPTFEDLTYLVASNPFVPPGHEGIFLRGLHAGFHGDFLVASHLLVPQIENSLRYVLESQGVDVSNLMSDGTQPVKVLGAIFGMEETKKIFGDSLCFELRGCLIEKTGFDFRNRLAHGFVSEGECYAPAAEMIWWLVLRICLIPIYHSQSAPPENSESELPEKFEDAGRTRQNS
jgi:hypothetical protein